MFVDSDAVMARVRAGFHGARVLVVGDAMLDRYLDGEVSRISPEAPVPVVRLKGRRSVAGGAANVAANLAGLGCHAVLCAAVGADAGRDELLGLLQAAGIESALVEVPRFPTIVKTRVLGGHQQMLRIDDEQPSLCDAAAVTRLSACATALIADVRAVVLSDYAKGVVQPALAQAVIRAAREAGVPVLVDPKGADWSKYRGASTVTPNTAELAQAAHAAVSDTDALVAAAQRLRRELELDVLTFTRGEHGIALIEAERTVMVPTQAREVFDVSGAGDTVIATMAAGLADGLPYEDAMRLANIAAGVVVAKLGTVPVTRQELEHAIVARHSDPLDSKIMDWTQATRQIAAWRAAGECVVFTNGCFDILHAGHVQYLERSRRTGDRLVVGLNSDASVRRLKGATRPINTEADRAAVLAALACIDGVVIFDQDTPLELVKTLRPQVITKGADYRADQVVGAADVIADGGRVALIDLLPGRSTSAIIARSKS